MTKIALQMMGMRCFKCLASTGSLCIPIDSDDTPESIGKILQDKRVFPVCDKCQNNNPMTISFEQLQKEK